MRVKYLKNRQCPKCRAKVVVMLLQYGSTMSTLNGVCRKCDHSMKWLILGGKASAPAHYQLNSVAVETLEIANDQAVKSR